MDINYIKYGAEKYNEIRYSTPHNEKKYVLVSSTGARKELTEFEALVMLANVENLK